MKRCCGRAVSTDKVGSFEFVLMLEMTVRKFAEEVVGPRVYAMDEAEQMDPVRAIQCSRTS